MTHARTDVEQVELANTAFYEALERGDFDGVSDLWLDAADLADAETYTGAPDAGGDADADDEADPDDGGEGQGGADAAAEGPAISCVHPGWPVLTGRGEVLRSYALIMANTEYIQFFLTDLRVSVAGDTALVTCTENILSGGPAPQEGDELGPLVGQLVVATNVFRRTCDGWKLWSHHASPVLAETGDDEDDEPPA
ncbi:nuclear transport factor 2 family protein [Streptomyces flavofungini]|uniref:Nuclear transport factor 2 family protein n=1 Tax=Streptomyces flavofungini TaxID=68200 RepID=A0ABS0XGQ7_9ACTN|nr:nuclear transport factor 2 family protein [Streptomyces flavofungini]MBJ3812407.1 nuclear transport factor 2 family protein [Streptomyces flavofungini]GHC73451.1 3-dehydroquinate dehydratase [Streptomyces flavofungini]